jgi:hypothetical protein
MPLLGEECAIGQTQAVDLDPGWQGWGPSVAKKTDPA